LSLSVRFTTCLIFLAVRDLRPGGRVASFNNPSHPLGGVASPPAAHGEHALAYSRRNLDRTNALAGKKHDLRPPHNLLRRVEARCITDCDPVLGVSG
jgi:hypothetical protein